MSKNLIIVLTFLLVLVVYVSFFNESKIVALGVFLHPIFWAVIFLIGKENLKRVFTKSKK